MSNIIADIDISSGGQLNSYAIHNDGTYRRKYNRNIWSWNIEETGSISEIENSIRETLLAKCEPGAKASLQKVLDDNPLKP